MVIEEARERGWLLRGELLELCLGKMFTAEVEVGRENKLCGCGLST